MQIPNLIKVETISDILDLLGDQTKLGKRTKDLATLEATLRELLKRYNDLTDVEAYLQAATAKMEEANAKMAEAQSLNSAKLEEVAKVDAEIVGKREALANDVRSARQFAAEHQRKLNERETQLIEREKDVAEREKNASALSQDAQEKIAQATGTISLYNEKMARLKELAA